MGNCGKSLPKEKPVINPSLAKQSIRKEIIQINKNLKKKYRFSKM